MKIMRNIKSRIIEDVKIRYGAGPAGINLYWIELDGKRLGSKDVLMSGMRIVNFAPDEVELFNHFFDDVRFHVIETNDFFLGQQSAYNDIFKDLNPSN